MVFPTSTEHCAASITVGKWRAIRSSGELVSPEGRERLEPKVMDLLFLLASRPNDVVTKEEIMAEIWPGVIVGDDTLARTISKLRKTLGDDPKAPRFIQTLHKRGYRYIGYVGDVHITVPSTTLSPTLTSNEPRKMASTSRKPAIVAASAAVGTFLVALIVVVAGITLSSPDSARAASRVGVERANDYYFQYSRADNEAAIELYERIIATDTDYSPAYAGLANALVQRVIRWPNGARGAAYSNLADALKDGHTRSANGVWSLERARDVAQQAVELAPEDPASHKALGVVFSAQEDFENALASYRRAVALDKNAWGPMINIGDLLEISGRAAEALPYFEEAYSAMTRRYDKETTRIRPWYAETAVLIGDRHRGRGDMKQAEAWYRRVLEYAPFHRTATARLAAALSASGDSQGAAKLCMHFELRIGRSEECARYRGNVI